MNTMFGLIAGALDLIYAICLVAFVCSGIFFVVTARNAHGAIRSKRNSRALKFFGLAVGLIVLGWLVPVPLVTALALIGGAVAYNRTRKVKYPLNGRQARTLPWNNTY
jgi:hypothetical protein